jgi:hypothetical protein
MTSSATLMADPADYSRNIQRLLSELIIHTRDNVEHVNDPQFRALMETSAEVLSGLRTAYEHYDQAREPAWQR